MARMIPIPRHDHEALEFLAVGSAVLLTAIVAVVYAVIQAVRRKP